jgi:hypothetical protein
MPQEVKQPNATHVRCVQVARLSKSAAEGNKKVTRASERDQGRQTHRTMPRAEQDCDGLAQVIVSRPRWARPSARLLGDGPTPTTIIFFSPLCVLRYSSSSHHLAVPSCFNQASNDIKRPEKINSAHY